MSFYGDQALRFAVLRDFPFHPEGVGELADALERAAGDQSFTRSLVDHFVQSLSGQCPVPADISRVAYEQRKVEGIPVQGSRNKCQECGGTGWRFVKRLMTPGGCEPYEGTECLRCPCSAAVRPEMAGGRK